MEVDYKEQTRRQKVRDYLSGDWEFIDKDLEKEYGCGDFRCGQVMVEWKNKDIVNMAHLKQQAKAMKKTGLKCHIIIEHSYEVTRMLFDQRDFKGDPLPGFMASLSAMGMKVWHLDTEENAFKFMEKLFLKENDGTDRSQINIKITEITGTDTERIYASQIGVGDTMARELAKRFPVPNDFFSQALDCGGWKDKDWKAKMLGRYKSILIMIRKRFYGVKN